MFADEYWYIERQESEVRLEGVLARHPHTLGPGSRGGLDFVFTGPEGIHLVYSAGVEDRLGSLVGRTIVVHGKLVEAERVVELWIGTIEPG